MANTRVTVEQAIAEGERIISTHPGYSMEDRVGPNNYDCSGFMGVIWQVPGAPATASMVEEYPKYGFDHYTYGSVSLKKGDILVHPTVGENIGHTAMVYNDSATQTMESWGGHGPGIRNWTYSDGYWQHILRGSGGFYIDKWQPTDGRSRGFHH